MIYVFLYGIARFGCEFLREPDFQLGYLAGGWLTMGQILSMTIVACSLIGYAVLARINEQFRKNKSVVII